MASHLATDGELAFRSLLPFPFPLKFFGTLFFGDADGFGELFAGECFFLGVGFGFDLDLDFLRFGLLCFFGVEDFSSSLAFLTSESSSFDFGVGSGVLAAVASAFFFGLAGFGFVLGDLSGVGDGFAGVSSCAVREAARFFFSSSLNSARTSVVSAPPATSARMIQMPKRAVARWRSGGRRSFTQAAVQPRAREPPRVAAHDAELRSTCHPEAATGR